MSAYKPILLAHPSTCVILFFAYSTFTSFSRAERQGGHAGCGRLVELHPQGFPLYRPTHPQCC